MRRTFTPRALAASSDVDDAAIRDVEHRDVDVLAAQRRIEPLEQLAADGAFREHLRAPHLPLPSGLNRRRGAAVAPEPR